MSAVKTNVFMNWKNVAITGPLGTPVPLKQVTDIQEANAEGLEMWRADGNVYSTVVVRATADVAFTIACGDVAGMMAVPRGVPLTVTATLCDALNGLGTGALVHTWVNAVVGDNPASGPTNKFAGGSITLMCFSPDGATPPLTVVQTP